MKIILTNPRQLIHPALDFTNDSFFIGFWGLAKDEKTQEEKEVPMFLSEFSVLREEELSERLIKLNKRFLHIDECRFSMNFLNRFLNNGVDSVYNERYLEVGENSIKTLEPPLPSTLTTLSTLNTPFLPLYSTLSRYVEFPQSEDLVYVVFWVIGTYFFPLFNTFPYLFLNGLKQSGKTKTQNFLAQTCFNALHSGSITASAVFRIIDAHRPTLLIDEVDVLAVEKNTPELRTLLLNGYKKGAKVIRSVQKGQKTDFEVERFEVYCPKAISNILGLDDVLEDRCVSITMLRAKLKKFAMAEIDEKDKRWQVIRDLLYCVLIKKWKVVKETYENLQNNTDLLGREWELWKPIFTLAKVFGDDKIYQMMISYALQKSSEKRTENITEQTDYLLVQILGDVVIEDNFYAIKDFTEKLKNKFDEEQKWLNARWVGRALKRIGFKEKRRVGSGVEYFLRKEKVQELLQRLQIEPLEKTQDVQTIIIDILKDKISYSELEKLVLEKLGWQDDVEGKIYNVFCNLKEKGEIFETEPGLYKVVR